MRQIFAELGLPDDFVLPQKKRNVSKTGGHYGELYSPQDRDYVAERFTREIEWMGYTDGGEGPISELKRL